MKILDAGRFGKAATPRLGGSLRLDTRIIGQNPRKRKLSESPGTNPSKMDRGLGGGEASLMSGKSRTKGGLTSDTAPFKHEAVEYPIGAGGPGLVDPTKP